MFARVQVAGSPPYEALLVPDAAVGTEQTRKFVLTVGADNKVVPKYVTLGQITKDSLRVIKSGIGPDDRIIVNGLMRARPGQAVTPQQEDKPGAAPAPGTQAPQAPK
jgi:multidrug efflux pump subunit AcrA (membrane-fusion protein)